MLAGNVRLRLRIGQGHLVALKTSILNLQDRELVDSATRCPRPILNRWRACADDPLNFGNDPDYDPNTDPIDNHCGGGCFQSLTDY